MSTQQAHDEIMSRVESKMAVEIATFMKNAEDEAKEKAQANAVDLLSLACQRYAQQADWLLSEAFCLFSEREQFKPYEKHHSTARVEACTAAQLGAKNLVLYHTQDNCLPERKRLYTAEARQCFFGPVYVPDDLQTIVL